MVPLNRKQKVFLSTAPERNKGDGATRWPGFRASQSRRKEAVPGSGCLGLQGRGAALEEWLCLTSEVTLMLFMCQLLISCGQIFFSCILSTQRPSVLYHVQLLDPEFSCLKGVRFSLQSWGSNQGLVHTWQLLALSYTLHECLVPAPFCFLPERKRTFFKHCPIPLFSGHCNGKSRKLLIRP